MNLWPPAAIRRILQQSVLRIWCLWTHVPSLLPTLLHISGTWQNGSLLQQSGHVSRAQKATHVYTHTLRSHQYGRGRNTILERAECNVCETESRNWLAFCTWPSRGEPQPCGWGHSSEYHRTHIWHSTSQNRIRNCISLQTAIESKASHTVGKKQFNNVVSPRTISTCTTKLPFLACLVAGISERIPFRKLPQVRHFQLQQVKYSSQ